MDHLPNLDKSRRLSLDENSSAIRLCHEQPEAPAPNVSQKRKDVLVWEIVGGREAGGILSRSQCSLSSEKLSQRISTGAFVLELEHHISARDGERLHYRRLTGTGPDEGWLTPSLKQRVLAVKVDDFTSEEASRALEIAHSLSR